MHIVYPKTISVLNWIIWLYKLKYVISHFGDVFPLFRVHVIPYFLKFRHGLHPPAKTLPCGGRSFGGGFDVDARSGGKGESCDACWICQGSAGAGAGGGSGGHKETEVSSVHFWNDYPKKNTMLIDFGSDSCLDRISSGNPVPISGLMKLVQFFCWGLVLSGTRVLCLILVLVPGLWEARNCLHILRILLCCTHGWCYITCGIGVGWGGGM